MRVLWLVALCACDRVLHLDSAEPADGPAPDAPFACPPIGTAPQFSSLLHQATTVPCRMYSESLTAQLAVAQCPDISEGPIDGSLAPARITFTAGELSVLSATVDADGDELWILQHNSTIPSFTLQIYTRAGDGSWQPGDSLILPLVGNVVTPSPPTARATGPRRFFYAYEPAGSYEIDEYEEQAPGTWTVLQPPYSVTELGITALTGLTTTSDGLRLVVANNDGVAYTDRLSTSARFGPVVPLVAPIVQNPFLREDCARLYTDEISDLFYAQQ